MALDTAKSGYIVKKYRIYIFILLAVAAAIAGYYYGDFDLPQKPTQVTDLADPEQDDTIAKGEEAVEEEALRAEKGPKPPLPSNAQEEASGQDAPTPEATQTSPSSDKAETSDQAGTETEGEAGDDKPSFDVVRVEPNGETLIAGQALPNAKIFIEKNGEVIAETSADETGAFVALPQNAIKGENNQIIIRSVAEDGTETVSDQVVAIGVPGDGEPLVALVEPGKAIEILQKPKTQELAGDLAAKAAAKDEIRRAAGLADEQQTSAESAAAEGLGAESSSEDISSSEESANDETQIAAVEPADAQARTANEPVGFIETEEAEPVTPTTQSPAPAVSVEAVEVDGDKIFIAGEGKAGKNVRVYVDGENIGDVKVDENGRWLYENKKALEPGEYTIRVDQLTTATSGVSARAEVPFVVEDKTASDFVDAGNAGKTIIIRRNDNLWTIAQRLYGDGLRYTAIYEQNRDQIRDPNLIFPGQTFTLPAEGASDQSPN